MKVARFKYEGQVTYGFVFGDRILDFSAVSRILGIDLPETVEKFIESELIAEVLTGKRKLEKASRNGIKLADVRLLAPLTDPPKIICLGWNYVGHVREGVSKIPEEPVVFMKPRTSIAGPYDDIEIPSDYTRMVDYEGELAFVIGKRGKRISKEDAYEYVFGYMVFNDVSARDLQFKDGQWTRGKSLDKFAPIGPWLITRDEIGDPHTLRLTTRVNGEIRQDSSTANMVFKVHDIIHILSKGMTFEPGDIVATGTPEGVGYFYKPEPKLLKHGDVVEISIERIGTIRNRFLFI